jgi:molybdopterin-guanine dinucleotide biosynthesis protein A
MPERYPELAAFVLVGGASRRMGRPKHDLAFGSGTLLARAVRLAGAVGRTVTVLGPPGRACGLAVGATGLEVPALPDAIAGRGPLGAILSGLSRTRTEYNLFLSCDLPFMHARFLRYLAGHALQSQADVTLAYTPREGYQPLAAIYRRRARTAVRASLERGHNKITRFFSRVHVGVLRWPELTRAGFQPFIFDNLNTPEDYERALGRIRGS